MNKRHNMNRILMVIANVLWVFTALYVDANRANDIVTGTYGAASIAIIMGDILYVVRKYRSMHHANNR